MIKLGPFVFSGMKKRLFESEASEEAKRLGLKSKGWGRWYDENDNYVARTVDGKLVKVEPGDAGDEDDPNMAHVNPYDSGVSINAPDHTYTPGKGFVDKDGTPFSRRGPHKYDPSPVHRAIGQLAPKSPNPRAGIGPDDLGGNVDYYDGKGFYSPNEPLQGSDWDSRGGAVWDFVRKNGGAEKTLNTVAAATRAAKQSGDKNEQWKALRLAKQFKKDLFEMATDSVEEISSHWKEVDDTVGQFARIFDEIGNNERVKEDWQNNLDASTLAEYCDIVDQFEETLSPETYRKHGDMKQLEMVDEIKERMEYIIGEIEAQALESDNPQLDYEDYLYHRDRDW